MDGLTNIKITPDLRYRHVSRWQTAFDPAGRGEAEYQLAYHGENVKAAIESGIINGILSDMVEDLTPGEVVELSSRVLSAIADAMAPPKKKT